MSLIKPTEVLSHWSKMIEGMQQSANEFYVEVQKNLEVHKIKDVGMERVTLSEGGLFSANREYLQIRHRQVVYHICAAPYGNGFFVSSWLGEFESGFWAWVAGLPYIGAVVRLVKSFVKPLTYYKIDTAEMFHAVAHGAVTKALDSVLQAKGLHSLTESDRKPVMRDLLSRL